VGLKQTSEVKTGRRDFIKKALYVAPAIVTLSVIPSFASAGSGYRGSNHGSEHKPRREHPRGKSRGKSRGNFWKGPSKWL